MNKMRYGSVIAALAAVAFSGASLPAQRAPSVMIQQIPRSASSSSRQAETSSQSANEAAGARAAPTPPVPALIEACRSAQLGGTPPDGVDCRAVLSAAAALSVESSAEGSLLPLFGQSSTVTQGAQPTQNANLSADDVARELSNLGAQGVSSGEAAAIADRQRGVSPPSSPPR
jgi:hypothetical protein